MLDDGRIRSQIRTCADPGGPKTYGAEPSDPDPATLLHRNVRNRNRWRIMMAGEEEEERMLGRRQVESGKDGKELKKAGRTGR